MRIIRRLVQKTQKRLNGIEGIKQQPVFLLYLCKDRLIFCRRSSAQRGR